LKTSDIDVSELFVSNF